MDLSDYSSLTFSVTHGDAFYFQVDNTDFEADSFHKSRNSSIKWIKNKDNQFLVMGNGDQLLFQPTPPQSEAGDSSAQFIIQPYNENPQFPTRTNRGRAITMFAMKDNKRKVVCCSQTGEVHADTLDVLPDQIGDGGHKALFFLKSVTGISQTYTVESSLCHSRFLGFEADAQNLSMNRLILRPMQERVEIDECTNFYLF